VPPSESAPYLGSDGPGDARLASHPPGPRGLAPKRGRPAPDADPPGAKGMGCVDPLRRRSPCAGVAISVYMEGRGSPEGLADLGRPSRLSFIVEQILHLGAHRDGLVRGGPWE
jgi:hypothetical protein